MCITVTTGITILGEKIEIDAAEDIRILILLWKMGVGKSSSIDDDNHRSHSSTSNSASNMDHNSNFVPGTIQASEWKYGCMNLLHVDSWESLASIKPSLDTGFLEMSEFRDFYKFCFRFNLSGTHRTLDSETAVMLLRMIFMTNNNTDCQRIDKMRLESFCAFLEDPDRGKPYLRITLDQWMSFWDFCQEIPNNDSLISNSNIYDESTSAWPVLIDDYVDYVQQLGKKK